ncbi:hypothetical protein GCM10009624_18250 [Gordonia sinesedis]
MNAHTDRVRAELVGSPAPRNLKWRDFDQFWREVADDVTDESGDRLSVSMNGHREVFRRPHNGVVSIEDVERARHLLADTPKTQGVGALYVVAMDERNARLIVFDLDSVTVDAATERVRDSDSRARHLRTVERQTGNDDVRDLDGFFKELVGHVKQEFGSHDFVLLGHGAGKSNAAEDFDKWVTKHDPVAREHIAGIGRVDLSAANNRDLEQAAQKVVQGQ